MILLDLAWRSLWNRRWLALITIASVALSVLLLLGVEKVREGTRAGFAGTVSGTDLIIGARSGGLQLMLYSVFRIGEAPTNFTWQTFEEIADRPEVNWMIPISLGDSHRGFRVVGTDGRYFEHLRYRDGQALAFVAGAPMADIFDTVLGATVAAELGYELGDPIVINHGLGSEALAEHADRPFLVSGILEATGTPVDRSVHVQLSGIEALHVDVGTAGGQGTSADAMRAMSLRPTSITAAFVGLRSPIDTFTLQRQINQYAAEPLSAVLPGMALLELWSMLEIAETALRAISAMVVVVAFAGMTTTILAMLSQRRREMAILRAVGASPRQVSLLLLCESLLLAVCGTLIGALATLGVLDILRPWIDATYGLYLPPGGIGADDGLLLAMVLAAAFVAGLVPARRAYRQSIVDGISPLE